MRKKSEELDEWADEVAAKGRELYAAGDPNAESVIAISLQIRGEAAKWRELEAMPTTTDPADWWKGTDPLGLMKTDNEPQTKPETPTITAKLHQQAKLRSYPQTRHVGTIFCEPQPIRTTPGQRAARVS